MFKTVIVGVDGGAGGIDALALAELLADPGATPVAAHVIAGESRRDAAQQMLDEVAARADAPLVTKVQQAGAPAEGLHELATELGADLIVIGACSHGMIKRLLGGDDTKATLRGAPCAVAIAPRGFRDAPHAIAQVGVGYDGSAGGRAALEHGRGIAARAGTRLHVMDVAAPARGLTDPIGISAVASLEAARDDAEQRIAELGPDVDGRTVDGIAHQRLSELSERVDLLIVGSSRHGTLGRVMLGSTSEVLSHEASSPLLVVPRPVADEAGTDAGAVAT